MLIVGVINIRGNTRYRHVLPPLLLAITRNTKVVDKAGFASNAKWTELVVYFVRA
jgi:hypothetical protein